jgi:hypothetical protein
MSDKQQPVNNVGALTNVVLALTAMNSAVARDNDMPGILCLHGRSGLGKSKAAAYLTVKFDACYIEGCSVWSRKAYLENILKDLGIHPHKTMWQMLEQIGEELSATGRPLIIDEADYLVDKGLAPLVMDIYQVSQTPILLIGEERLPSKLLARHEKIHNRVLHWISAQPASAADCQTLATMFAPKITIATDLLDHINKTVEGCTRRVVVNINLVQEFAIKAKASTVDRAWWGDRELYTGKSTNRRAA